jgi:hypothetical protein
VKGLPANLLHLHESSFNLVRVLQLNEPADVRVWEMQVMWWKTHAEHELLYPYTFHPDRFRDFYNLSEILIHLAGPNRTAFELLCCVVGLCGRAGVPSTCMYKASPVLLLFQDHLFVIIKGLSKCGTYSHGTPCIIYQWAMIVFLLYMVNLHKQHVLHENGGPDGCNLA